MLKLDTHIPCSQLQGEELEGSYTSPVRRSSSLWQPAIALETFMKGRQKRRNPPDSRAEYHFLQPSKSNETGHNLSTIQETEGANQDRTKFDTMLCKPTHVNEIHNTSDIEEDT